MSFYKFVAENCVFCKTDPKGRGVDTGRPDLKGRRGPRPACFVPRRPDGKESRPAAGWMFGCRRPGRRGRSLAAGERSAGRPGFPRKGRKGQNPLFRADIGGAHRGVQQGKDVRVVIAKGIEGIKAAAFSP